MNRALARARALLHDLRESADPSWDNPEALAQVLYTRWYHATSPGVRICPDLSAYRAAHACGAGFEPGWHVSAQRPEAGPGAIVAERAGEQRLVYATNYVPADATRLRVAPGDAVLLNARIDELNGGFWHLWSPEWRKAPPTHLVRIYFQVAAGNETAFVTRLCRHAPFSARWNMKILAGTHQPGRVDAAVVYVDRDEGIRAPWLAPLIKAVTTLLNDDAPAFTARLAPGVAWAEDPGGGLSFGEHRCRILADAAIRQPAALRSARMWRRAAALSFTREGLDLGHPHLQGRSRARVGNAA
jgi:HopA1 effector protein family